MKAHCDTILATHSMGTCWNHFYITLFELPQNTNGNLNHHALPTTEPFFLVLFLKVKNLPASFKSSILPPVQASLARVLVQYWTAWHSMARVTRTLSRHGSRAWRIMGRVTSLRCSRCRLRITCWCQRYRMIANIRSITTAQVGRCQEVSIIIFTIIVKARLLSSQTALQNEKYFEKCHYVGNDKTSTIV